MCISSTMRVWMVIPCCPRIGLPKSSMVCSPKVWLSRARDNDYLLQLGCDCAVLFISQAILVERIKKRGGKSKLAKALTTKTWYLGRGYRMWRKLAVGGSRIDNHLTSGIGLPIRKHDYVGMKLRRGSMWTYDLSYHLM